MNLTKSSNPVLNDSVFSQMLTSQAIPAEAMTVNGTVRKTALSLAVLVAAAVYSWQHISGGFPLIISAIGTFAVAIVTAFKPALARYTAIIYAVLEGVLLGVISRMMEQSYQGLVARAVVITFGVFLLMLVLYRSGVIKVSGKFATGLIAATGGVALLYLGSFIARLCGVDVSFLSGSSTLSIGISIVVAAIAALNLILDFDFIERGAAMNAPKTMEWYGAFGLMVTLVWLYIEILRLLAKIAARRN
ncbi:MAG: Bax inhibitor-1/YccA family protein [Bacteroidales bacterium]|jgi:uncharacterized YccA/Bax inhibitor family protein|nr:Bax inhibitor-1/YccA family protein [Bacteroidales bacterium]